MTESGKITTWAVTDALRVYQSGKLVAVIPTDQFPALLVGLALSLLTGCAGLAGSATSDTICRELARDLPTYSRNDTADTLAAGARFIAVFDAVCGQ